MHDRVLGIRVPRNAVDRIPDPPYIRRNQIVVGPRWPRNPDAYFVLMVRPDNPYCSLTALNVTQRGEPDDQYYALLYDLTRQTLEPLGLWDEQAFGFFDE